MINRCRQQCMTSLSSMEVILFILWFGKQHKGNLQQIFWKSVSSKNNTSHELGLARRLDIVWDCNNPVSIKESSKDKRGHSCRQRVTGSANVLRDWQTFLKNADNKKRAFYISVQYAADRTTAGPKRALPCRQIQIIINLNTFAAYLGDETCKSLALFHALTGSDSTSTFKFKEKRSCWNIRTKCTLFPFIQEFAKITDAPYCVSSSLREANYVCKLYRGEDNQYNVDHLRMDIFRHKMRDVDRLPPTSDPLH